MASWLFVLLLATAVFVAGAVLLLGVGVVGERRKTSTGPTVILGRVLFSVMLVAVAVGLAAGLWGMVATWLA